MESLRGRASKRIDKVIELLIPDFSKAGLEVGLGIKAGHIRLLRPTEERPQFS